jgi:hypothetical protein
MAFVAADLRDGSAAEVGDSLAIASLSLARRFAHGATLWCVSPEWPEHARHVAVEFVHPVIVGKRALPAVSVDGSNLVGVLRSSVRSGDVILAVSTSGSQSTIDTLRRAGAWGAATIWIGAGPRPESSPADHLLWSDDDGLAAHDGRLVLLYHVLWELTHVCFEHPGLLSSPPAVEGSDHAVCVTCSDEGRLGEVIATSGRRGAQVRTARGIETISTMVVDPVECGDLVLIHAGAAIAVVA